MRDDIRPDWFDRAECSGRNPAIFYPSTTNGAAVAAAICAFCETQVECRDKARAWPEIEGVWGGLRAEQINSVRPPQPPRRLYHGDPGALATCSRRPEGSCVDCRAATRRSA